MDSIHDHYIKVITIDTPDYHGSLINTFSPSIIDSIKLSFPLSTIAFMQSCTSLKASHSS